jgi:hypothetical protein
MQLTLQFKCAVLSRNILQLPLIPSLTFYKFALFYSEEDIEKRSKQTNKQKQQNSLPDGFYLKSWMTC